MKTDSELDVPLAVLFSEKGRGFIQEYTLTLKDGTTYDYMLVTHTEENGKRPPIIPYFWDAHVVAEICPQDVLSTTQGRFERIGASRAGEHKVKRPAF